MAYALSKYPKTYFGDPDVISESVPQILKGNWQVPDAEGNIYPHDLLYWTDKNNPLGHAPTTSSQDPQFQYWEYGVSSWYASHPELFINPSIFVPISYQQTATTTQ